MRHQLKAMGEFVIRAADAFGLGNPHVVGPDVGTAAALFAAALYPGRLRSLVVGSGGAAVPLQLGGVLKDWVDAPDLDRFTWEDAADDYAALVTNWWGGGYGGYTATGSAPAR
ncbi:MAG TPA: hypothetical protein VE733_28745 [Streptosporangiaceae bacterium]|nr:hypothetical protein [Streptosporangiaceae bacterium]